MTTEEIIQDAQQTLSQINAMGQSASGATADKFSQYGSQIQSLLNTFLSGYGVMKQEQVDKLDFELRQAKIAMLDYKSRQTVRKYATIAVVTAFVLVAAYVIVKKTN
jgi:hypothetical protein